MWLTGRLRVEYVLPLRWTEDRQLAELSDYLEWLADRVDVTVVDGSRPDLFARHRGHWSRRIRQVRPDPDLTYRNGKVNGVVTGVRAARHDRVVLADDDVRYDEPALRSMSDLLEGADLVRPQNYFDPLPWHAVWDTGRTLLNRAVRDDYPGTFGLRRDTFLAMGGYDGNVLFENLELIRSVRAFGGTEVRPAGLYVRRVPPETAHFLGQRARQAYDDFAEPARMAVFLAVLPVVGLALAAGRPRLLAAGAAGVVLLAESGRRRAGGAAVFPLVGSLLAPAWLVERAVCSWWALGLRLRGGAQYTGGRLRRAAHSQRQLDRRHRRPPLVA